MYWIVLSRFIARVALVGAIRTAEDILEEVGLGNGDSRQCWPMFYTILRSMSED